MIGFTEAQRLVLDTAEVRGTTTKRLSQVVGYVSACEIKSPIDIPPFDNSAMDGFAVSTSALSSASNGIPVTLPVSGTLYAGDSPEGFTAANTAIKVMTGAAVPQTCDAVAPIEDVLVNNDRVTISTMPACGQNIRRRAMYFQAGEAMYRSGHQFTKLDVGVLASAGFDGATVYKMPRLHVCVTGNELVKPGSPLPDGKIYNSNLPLMNSLVSSLCDAVTCADQVEDDVKSLKTALESDADVIISSGGVSVGDRDYLPAVVAESGWKIIFHRVAIRPGKPVLFAKRGKQLLFGLPGNPLSAAIGLLIFVLPALRRMAGRGDFRLPSAPANISGPFSGPQSRTQIWPGKFHTDAASTIATLPAKLSSGNIGITQDTNGLVFIYTDDEIAKGRSPVEIISWRELLN